MRRNTQVALLMIIAMAATAATPAKPAAAPVDLARVNGEIITDADVKEAFVGKHGGHTNFLGGDSEARRFLNIVINERLLVQEAYNLELDLDPSVKPLVDDFRDRTMAEALLKREIGEKSKPSAEEIRAAWNVADQLFMAREIVADTRAEAEAARRALLSGADFDALARACSTGPTRTRGGSLSPFTWGSLPVEVENVAFTLEPGEISPVFQSADGWHVLLLTDRVDAFRPELDERVSSRIAAKLTERKKEELTKSLAARLWAAWDAKLLVTDFAPSTFLRLLESAPKTVLATWKGGELVAEASFTPAELRMFAAFPAGRGAAKVEETLRAAVNTRLVQLEARALKIDEEPAVAAAVARYEAKLIESALYKGHVLADVKVTDDELRAAYEGQKATLIIGERRRVSHIAVATESDAKTLRARIDHGEDYATLLKASTLDRSSLKTEGDLGWIEKGKVDAMYDPLFSLPLNGVSQPIQSPNAWHLIRVIAIEAEHPLAFDEAKEKIRSTLLEKKKHDAREVWIGKLREASEIELLEDGIKAFVQANPYEEPTKSGEKK